MTMLLDAANPACGISNSLRVVMLSGDWVPTNIARRIHHWTPKAIVAALGGATEAGIWSNIHLIERSDQNRRSIPYGTSLTSQDMQILDSSLSPRPDLVVGEICISGKSLAEGYLNRKELTMKKFVEDRKGVRWYKTGDLGRWLPQGEIEFLGRSDSQIKIRGNRIELAEIESTIAKSPLVAAVKVVVLGSREEHILAAAVVPSVGFALDEKTLVAHQQEYLPEAFICRIFVQFDELPLTANGKVDAKEIIRRCETRRKSNASRHLPTTPEEQAVAKTWCRILKTEAVGIGDSFFSLGGDSLSGTKMLAELKKSGYEGRLANLFEHPVLAEFARTLSSHSVDTSDSLIESIQQNDLLPFNLTSVQRAYLYGRNSNVELGGIGCTFYREYLVSQLDRQRLKEALDLVISRHPMLHVKIENGKQQVVEPSFVEIERFDCRSAMAKSLSRRLFDPANPPLIAIGEAPAADGCYLGIVFDNLVVDAASVLLVLEEIDAAYNDLHSLAPVPQITFQKYITTSPSSDD